MTDRSTIFLTPADVAELTGYQRPAYQIRRLRWRVVYCVKVAGVAPGDLLLVTGEMHVTTSQRYTTAWVTDLSVGPNCYHGGRHRRRLTLPWWRLAQPSGQNVSRAEHHDRMRRTTWWEVPEDAPPVLYVRMMAHAR